MYVQVMLNAAPSFLNVFHRLVASIMQEGRQRGETDTGSTSDKKICNVTINWFGERVDRREAIREFSSADIAILRELSVNYM